jgi:DinB superfamily
MIFHNLQALLEDKERVLESLQSTVLPLSAKQRTLQPATGQWSVAEIVEHLAKVEPDVMRVIESLTRKAEGRVQGGAAAPWSAIALSDDLANNEVGKIRTRPSYEPSSTIPLEDSLDSLWNVQTALVNLRPRLERLDLSGISFPHATLGSLSLGQWIAFLGIHERRHLGQIVSVTAALTRRDR